MNYPSFIGLHFYSVDAKNRLAIPAKMRLGIPDHRLVICSGQEQCLNLFTMEGWAKLNEKLDSVAIKNKIDQRDFKRNLYASASDVELDEEGRILIPQQSVEYSRLKKEVAVLGMGNKIEVWSKEIWLQSQKKRDKTFKKHAAELDI